MILAVAILVAAIVGFMRWRSSLDGVVALGPAAIVPVQVGQTYYVDAGLGPVPTGRATVQDRSPSRSTK